jgi:hypothetical protein
MLQVASDLWLIDGDPVHPFGLTIPIRMTVVRLSNGALLLHSPIQFSAKLADSLRALGPIRHLLAPSVAHWTLVADWQRACPEAQTLAVPNLRRRRPVRRAGLRIDAEISDSLPADWQADLAHVFVQGGAGFCELALFHRPSRTAILTDLVQWLDPAAMPARMRPVAALLGMTGQDGRPPIAVRLAFRLRGRAARAAARAIVAWQPERVIFSHGAWFAQDGTARLRKALSWLLAD